MELKKYQQTVLDKLSLFLKELESQNPKYAFMYQTNNTYNDAYFGSDIPFICFKVPTGGGKTFVGCHAVDKIVNSFLKEKLGRGIVLWFVPSEPIKTQTLKKFKDRKDLHRKILDESFDNKVMVLSNEEALRIRKSDIENNLCIIVASLDAFRKEEQKRGNYKVYQENGELLTHFENMPETDVLEKDDSGVIHSLANVIRMDSPLIVIDEGHRTKTVISIDFLKSLNPSFVLEFTATPREGSNILVDVHSSELKDAEMVKLPLVLESHTQWQNAMSQGILRRDELESVCKKQKEPIRPIALIQAEQEKEDEKKVTVGKIKEFLIKEKKIPEEQIAIKTSKNNELEGIELFSKDCEYRYILTVNALAEGWDCSFAYVLISVANIGASVAVEQIIGRIMRMPFAKKREQEDLNKSYVFASAKNFNEAVSKVISALESNGYSKLDILSSSEATKPYSFDVKRKFKENFWVPRLSIGKEELTFEELIGEDFELSKQKPDFNFIAHYDLDGRTIIDIKEDDKWHRTGQQILKLTHKDKNITENDLVQWLDKKLRYPLLEKEDKTKFLEKLIKEIKGFSVSDLSVNRYVLAEQISQRIDKILNDTAEENYKELKKKGKIALIETEPFPETITLKSEQPITFQKNYYEKVDKLNKEELAFVERLNMDTLPNIEFWIRNREKEDFYLQGWKKNKFYPDIIARTKGGAILLLEWKGEDRVSNEDTQYKVNLGKEWEELGKSKQRFFLVHNKNIEATLEEIKKIK